LKTGITFPANYNYDNKINKCIGEPPKKCPPKYKMGYVANNTLTCDLI